MARLKDGVEGKSRAAREKAQQEYEDRWNMRPALSPPAGLLAALESAAERIKSVRCLTLADVREGGAGVPHLRLGVFVERGAAPPFEEARDALAKAVRPVLPRHERMEIEELDLEVRPVNTHGETNAYVIFSRAARSG